MKLFRINSVGSALRAAVAWPMLLVGMYMLAALVGSSIAVNADWKPAQRGHTVYVYDNGVHTSLIFARELDGLDLGLMVADPLVEPKHITDSPTDTRLEWPTQLPDSRFPGDIKDYPYIMIGWGDARFYRETPTWGAMRPGTVLTALFGSGTTLAHVDRLPSLPTADIKKLALSDEEFNKLYLFVAAHFPNNFERHYRPEPGYGPDDRFYPISHAGAEALHYSAFFTCNNWVSEALKRAGVKTGYWTPLPFGVMWWLPPHK